MTGKCNAVKLEHSVLSAEQQEKLRLFKIKTRIDNENYLTSHPEVELLVGDFLRNVLLKRPDDIREFAAEHFTDPKLQSDTVSTMDKTDDMIKE
uniref:RIIa domain-containing protein n=1 Tax=Neogobius melanostomus TaxID=47308 RepID=A0A8C6TYL6_9GOBI